MFIKDANVFIINTERKMQPTLGQRIKIIMDELSLTQAMISRASGIDNTKLSRILADKGDVMFKAIETLYLTYPQINPAYLLGGVLPVLLPKNPPIDRVTALERENELLNELLKAYRKIDDLKPSQINARG